MNKPLTRSEVAVETTWNLADLFATRDAWLAELAAVERSVESVVRYQGRLAEGAGVLLACLDERDDLLATARWDNSAFHGFQDYKTVVKGLVDEMMAKIKARPKTAS